ncbi:DUF6544 family protein [Salinigranum sp.]|uniref:DUF6920 family protein n=1 Tax=Salinigranum sp. TaxID=1966351 RepID=UPI00356994F4
METFDRGVPRASLAAAAVGGALAFVVLGRRRERRAIERVVDRLLTGTTETSERGREDDRTDLPDPVRRYLTTVLSDDARRTRSVRVEQEGTLRVGGRESPWRPFGATHHAAVEPPGFVWDATVTLPLRVPVRVRDAFVEDEGSSRVTLFGAWPLGGATGRPELNEAALQRYLAEAVWYPAALLPENGVSWEGVDDLTARATLRCGETTASLTFHFAEEEMRNHAERDGRGTVVERVHTERRYRAVDGGFEATPWTGLWREYEERAGAYVPTTGEVVWHLPEGDFHAWRGRVMDVDARQ